MKTFSADELAFLATIHESPLDDAPRLVYADWLDEHDASEHAEFIHLQCEEPYIELDHTRLDSRPMCSRIIPDDDSSVPHSVARLLARYPSFCLPDNDPTVLSRLERMLTLLPLVRKTWRYDKNHHHIDEVHYHGLPLARVRIDADNFDYATRLREEMLPIFRLRLTIEELFPDQLADWMSHPLMWLVDDLCLSPQSQFEIESFEEEDILILERSPMIDRLRRLNLEAPLPYELWQLAQERLAHRVLFTNDY